MIAHIAKRIAFIVLGYFAALVAGAAIFPGLLLIISEFAPASELWQLVGMGPIALVLMPVILVYIMSIVMILTFIPAAVFKLITEIFALRRLWLHLLISLSLAAGAGLMMVPGWFSAMNTDRWLITLAIGLSALVGGVVYWAIAGRMAGFRPETVIPAPRPAGAMAQKEGG
ncbi:MAG: hypothetical protein AB7F09_18470 [Parvibaculaceae bacterium]